MDSDISISQINDFLFCPKSLYLHSVYTSFTAETYHDAPQIKGRITHENIEKGQYTTAQHILQGLSVYCNRLGVRGRIDIYNSKTHELIERKYKVKQIYKGFRYQLYAQMYCLLEAGHLVKRLYIQSLSDNKRYEVSLPTAEEKKDFEGVLDHMKSFDTGELSSHSCSHCQNTIYSLLHW